MHRSLRACYLNLVVPDAAEAGSLRHGASFRCGRCGSSDGKERNL